MCEGLERANGFLTILLKGPTKNCVPLSFTSYSAPPSLSFSTSFSLSLSLSSSPSLSSLLSSSSLESHPKCSFSATSKLKSSSSSMMKINKTVLKKDDEIFYLWFNYKMLFKEKIISFIKKCF